MWRFLPPALAIMAAVVVLFAGALGDVTALPQLSEKIFDIIIGSEPPHALALPPPPAPATDPVPPAAPPAAGPPEQQASHEAQIGELRKRVNELQRLATQGSAEPSHPSPPAPAPASAPPPTAGAGQQAAREALQRQIADLRKQLLDPQQQTAQRSHDLDAARAETDRLRLDLDTLRQQRKEEEAVLARQKSQEQQVAATATPRGPASRPAVPPAQSSPPPVQFSPPPVQLSPPPAPVAPRARETLPESPPPASASQQLLSAQQWLATGRPDEARRILAMAQTQMVLQPVTPDQPDAAGGNLSATEVGAAIRWLDMGANNRALQAINRAIATVNRPDTGPRPWSGYPPTAPAEYSQPGERGYYTSSDGR